MEIINVFDGAYMNECKANMSDFVCQYDYLKCRLISHTHTHIKNSYKC